MMKMEFAILIPLLIGVFRYLNFRFWTAISAQPPRRGPMKQGQIVVLEMLGWTGVVSKDPLL